MLVLVIGKKISSQAIYFVIEKESIDYDYEHRYAEHEHGNAVDLNTYCKL